MKLSKKLIALLSAVLVAVLLVPSALAVGDTSAEAGKSVTVTFTFEDVYNVDGAFAVNDPQKILSTYTINVADAGSTAALVNGNRLWASPTGEPVKTTVSVAVVLSIKSTAAVGAKCTVSFTGIYGDANEAAGNEHDVAQSATVTVGEPVVAPTTAPSTDPAVTPTPSAPPVSDPAVTPSVPGSSGVDYAELEKQIAIASGLKMSDYNDQSRENLVDALSEAKAALHYSEQSPVTAAAQRLRAAIAGLVPMDYSRLKAALNRVDALLSSDQAVVLWEMLSETAEQGRQLLQSGDQQAVDQAADKLEELLADIAALLDSEPETKVVIQEVTKEVLPSGDYCNVGQHHLWTVLLVVSAVLNLCLIGVIVAYVIRRTKNRKDDTPLVSYDIDDDY